MPVFTEVDVALGLNGCSAGFKLQVKILKKLSDIMVNDP